MVAKFVSAISMVLVVELTSALATGVGGNNAQWTSSLIHSSITTTKTPFSPRIMLWHRKSIFQIPFKMPIFTVNVISILLFHLLNSSIPCRNMFHASNLSRQILWARSVSYPALMNIRSTLTTRQRHWQNPTHSADLTRVVMRQVQIKTTCDVTRITPDSSIFSVSTSNMKEMNVRWWHCARFLRTSTKLVLFLLLPLGTNTKLTFRQSWYCFYT